MSIKNTVPLATLAKPETTQAERISGHLAANNKKETTQEKKISELLARKKRLNEEQPEDEQKAEADKDSVHAEPSPESLQEVFATSAYQDPSVEFSDRIQLAQLGGDIAGAGAGVSGGVGAGATGIGTAGAAGAVSAGAWVAAGVAAGSAATVATAGVTTGAVALSAAVAGGVAALKNAEDDTAPVVTASQSLSYAENQAANAVVGTVAASDAVGVTGYRFENSGGTPGATSTDGYFTIAANGQVSITAAGVAAGVAQNDFETGANSFTYGIQARDAAGNWSSAVNVTFNVTDLIEFSYTENRRAGSFIGSVDASNYLFWDPQTQTRSNISPDGYFLIDKEGRIFLTAEGAASYVNDAEDTQAGGPINSHQYFIQAKAAGGIWSTPVPVTLNENNCRCDDPNLQYLIDLATTGAANRTLKDGRILSVTQDEFYQDVVTDLGPVDLGKQIVRMASTGGADAATNIVELKLSFLEPINTIDPSAFLNDLACINLQASKKVSLEVNSSQSIYGLGDPVLMDNFLPSLEKIYVSTQLIDSPQYAFSYLKFDNYGSYGWLPNLKDITIYAGGDAARMDIYNNRVRYGTMPSDVLRGDDFMQSLETIYMESFGTVALNINNQLGDAFMKSLTSITALGGSAGYGHTTLKFNNYPQEDMGIAGDDGYTDGFMTALEVVTARHQSGNAKIEFHNSTSGPGGADNYMSSLSLVDIYSTTEEALSFINGGGVNYMGSLAEINMINSTRNAYFTAINTSRMDETAGVLRTADNFMTGLKNINIETQGQINFIIKNEGEMYYLNDDYSTNYYRPSGDNFMSSLESISLDASANNRNVEFQMLVDVQDNPTALAGMQSLSIKGGEITAVFDTSLDETDWLNFSNIQGVSDGEQDYINFRGEWTDKLIVLGGFDTGAVDDIINIYVAPWAGHNITSLDDLIFSTEGNNIRISFEESLGYVGSIVLLNAASTFNQHENLVFIF